MIHVYINYPNPKFSVHGDPSCGFIHRDTDSPRRQVRINISSVSVELDRFAKKEYTFASTAGTNDMWLEIDFGDQEFEKALVRYIRKLIGEYYAPLGNAEIVEHC